MVVDVRQQGCVQHGQLPAGKACLHGPYHRAVQDGRQRSSIQVGAHQGSASNSEGLIRGRMVLSYSDATFEFHATSSSPNAPFAGEH